MSDQSPKAPGSADSGSIMIPMILASRLGLPKTVNLPKAILSGHEPASVAIERHKKAIENAGMDSSLFDDHFIYEQLC